MTITERPAPRTPRPGMRVATMGAILGGTVSVLANVLHARLAGQGGIAQGIAAVWPVVLIVSLEVMARPSWPRSWYAFASRWLGMGTVSLITGYVSYRHMSGLLRILGEEPTITIWGPVVFDGLMLLSAAALLWGLPAEPPSVPAPVVRAWPHAPDPVVLPPGVPGEDYDGDMWTSLGARLVDEPAPRSPVVVAPPAPTARPTSPPPPATPARPSGSLSPLPLHVVAAISSGLGDDHAAE